MANERLTATQREIEADGLSWTAGETPLSNLSDAEMVQWLGLTVPEYEIEAMAALTASSNAVHEGVSLAALGIDAPPTLDWRNKGGNWVTPIKDQAACGSCVSFGTLATIESRARIACNNASLAIDLAEAHLFYCGCGSCCGTGWNFGPALDFCKNTGVVRESDFPYVASNQPCKSVTPWFKIRGWKAHTATASRKDAVTRGPVVAGFQVYSDFFSYKSGVYQRTATATLKGNHAVSVIGYDDAQQCWICKNSWGPSWGDNGFFRIKYGQCNIDSGFAFYEPDVPCPSTTDCSAYVPYLRNVLSSARTNLALRRALQRFVCGRINVPAVVLTPPLRLVVASVSSVLARCPQYKAAFCAALP